MTSGSGGFENNSLVWLKDAHFPGMGIVYKRHHSQVCQEPSSINGRITFKPKVITIKTTELKNFSKLHITHLELKEVKTP